ncbi:MAG: tetratricopeptide repeat protein [Alphaproteobacteria bacterium]|nr:tetratricopeptide repeat protein [Alphaproteobacteria bacterium]
MHANDENGDAVRRTGIGPALAHVFALGRKMHLAGGLAVAERAYRQILAEFPEHLDSLRYLSQIAAQSGRWAEALDLLVRAGGICPDDPDIPNECGWLCFQQGRVAEAIAFGRKAVALAPESALAHARLADALKEDAHWAEAIRHYLIANGSLPEDPSVLFGLCVCHLALNDAVGALRFATDLARTHPDMAEAHYLKGMALQSTDDLREAVSALTLAQEQAPANARIAVNLAMALDARGAHEQAVSVLRNAETRHPDDAELLSALCLALLNRGGYAEAEPYGLRALALDPDLASANNALGRIRLDQWRLEEAERYFRRTMELRPDSASGLTNLAIVLGHMGKREESLSLAERAFSIAPTLPEAHFILATMRLTTGRLSQGWDAYELSRFLPPRAVLCPLDIPLLETDEDPGGKTILVRHEQGVGDSILFASVLPDLIRHAGHCIVECMPKVLPLMKRSFPEATVLSVPELCAQGAGLPVDRQILTGSLCRRYRSSLELFPAPHAFLVPDPKRVDAFRRRLAALSDHTKVAFLWRGLLAEDTPKNSTNYLTLEQLAPVLALPGFTFISIQYDVEGNAARREIETARTRSSGNIHVLEDLDPFDDLDGVAALIEACDMALGPPTTSMHIAGGLGKPALRWSGAPDTFDLAQSHCPLTPSVRTVVPTTIYDKSEIVRRLLEALDAHTHGRETVSYSPSSRPCGGPES